VSLIYLRHFLLILIILVPLTFALPWARAEDKKTIDAQFVSVSAYLITMTVFDVETTFSAVHNGAHEANPIMKPFVQSGRPATYAFEFGTDAIILFIAYEMKGSKNSNFNKTWFISPMIAGTVHGIAGGLNLRFAF
jgi:hypothetical protein